MDEKKFEQGDLVESREGRNVSVMFGTFSSREVPAGEQMMIVGLQETTFTCPRINYVQKNLLATVLSSVGIGTINTIHLRKSPKEV